MSTTTERRVVVMTDDGQKPGKYIGKVTVYAIVTDEGLLSNKLAEEKPTDEQIAASGGELVTVKDNPKIQLDSGEIVYGCQVWWDWAEGSQL